MVPLLAMLGAGCASSERSEDGILWRLSAWLSGIGFTSTWLDFAPHYSPAPTVIQFEPLIPKPVSAQIGVFNVSKYNENSLANPYGAGSPYKPDGLLNPYSPNGSKYRNKSWNNPYATEAPKLYDSQGNTKVS